VITTTHNTNHASAEKPKCALLTPHGIGGIAVIQLNSPALLDLFLKCYNPFNLNAPVTPQKITFGNLVDNDEVIDQVIVHLSDNEQSLEIHCHGGPRVVQRIMMKLNALGAEIMTWERIIALDTISQEVQNALAKSKTRLAISAISQQATGGLTKWSLETLRSLQSTQKLPHNFNCDIAKMIDQYRHSQLLQHLTTVALVGQPNVGKSTIANAICGRTQSIVCDLPGTTRDWTSEESEILGLPISIIDTPGIRDSNDPLEQASITTAKSIIAQAKLVIYIITFDQADHLTQKHIEPFITNLALRNEQSLLIIQNKIDLHEKSNICDLAISANNALGIEKVKQAIVDQLGFTNFDITKPMPFTARQYAIITQLQKATTPKTATPLLNKLLNNQQQ